jgi:hypothetical protein
MTYIEDLTSLTFHKWRVLGFSHVNANRKHYWSCVCQCGKEKAVESYNLTSGRSKSCRSCSSLNVAANCHATHRKSQSMMYKRWQGIKTRCYNSNQTRTYKDYGARGIAIAPEWKDDFKKFYEYMGEPPTLLHTIDRIDVNGNYEPGNVRWATQSEQMKNTRRAAKNRKASEQASS